MGSRPGLDALEKKKKSLAPAENRTVPRFSSPLSSLYTDYAVPTLQDI